MAAGIEDPIGACAHPIGWFCWGNFLHIWTFSAESRGFLRDGPWVGPDGPWYNKETPAPFPTTLCMLWPVVVGPWAISCLLLLSKEQEATCWAGTESALCIVVQHISCLPCTLSILQKQCYKGNTIIIPFVQWEKLRTERLTTCLRSHSC